MNLDKIFVVHYEPLTERKKYIDESLKRLQGIPIEYVIMNSDTDRFVNENFQRFYQGSSKISFQEVAVSIAHLEIFKDILHNNYKKCLIIEDDAILEDLFFDNIDKAISESDEFDFSFLSSCSNLHASKKRTGLLQESETSRTVCGYLVGAGCLEKVIRHCEPFQHVIDWQLNYLKPKLELRFAWSEPPIIRQGSEGDYKSNLHNLRMNR
jgi:GR25 family glycosyltransferase involved in LPS biosynthesis